MGDDMGIRKDALEDRVFELEQQLSEARGVAIKALRWLRMQGPRQLLDSEPWRSEYHAMCAQMEIGYD